VDKIEVLLLIGHLELAQRLGHQVGNAKATHLTLLRLVLGGIELGGPLLDPRPPFRERGLTPIDHKWVISQILVFMEVVVDLPPKCVAPLLGATYWILSNFHSCLAKAHILKLGEVPGLMGRSFGDLRLLLLKQRCLVDGDSGGMGATLGGIMLLLGATFRATTSFDHVGHGGVHGLVLIEVGLPYASGWIRIATSMNETKQAKL
jgi:hypothetical protein